MTGREGHCHRRREAGPYVLGELQGRRLDSFTRHLRVCEVCTDEVHLLRSAADAVPLLAARHVPTDLTEQEPERRAPTLAAAVARRQLEGAASARGGPTEAGRPALRPIPGGGGVSGRGIRRRVLQTPVPKPALIGLLALAIIAVVTVALSNRTTSVRYVRIKAGWSSGGAALKLQGNRLELLVEGMPRPAAGNGYQVWVVEKRGERLTPTTAWLHLNSRGEAGASLAGNYHDWTAVAVYVEPRHGRDSTASGAVVVGDLRKQS